MTHVTQQEFEAFLAGTLAPEDLLRVIRHLATRCAECRAHLDWELAAVDRWGYDKALDSSLERAIEGALREAPRWRRETEARDRLLSMAREDWQRFGRLRSQRHRWARVEALLELSREERFRDPERMLLLALCAYSLAKSLRADEYPPGLLADLRAKALGELANAYRLNDKFDKAQEALVEGEAQRQEGTGDALLLARLIDIEASLRSDQRRLAEAEELLDRLHRLYVSIGETHLAGRSLISKATAVFYDERPREAAVLCREGLHLLDPGRDSRLEAIAKKDLVDQLAEAGECREAGRLLLEWGLRKEFEGEPLILLRLRWIEGKIQAGLGRLERAARAFGEVREGILAQGREYEAALVGLELAAVWLDEGKNSEVRLLASEVLATFRHLGIHSEAVKAVGCLETACHHEEATSRQAREILSFVRRVEWQPHLRFAAS